jgi:hypothetical protein
MWNVTPRRFLDGTSPAFGGVPPDVDAFMGAVTDPDTPPYTLDAILRHPDAVALLLQNPDAFAQVVARQDILPRTLDIILEHQDAVELLRRNREAFVQVVARISPYIRRRLIEI